MKNLYILLVLLVCYTITTHQVHAQDTDKQLWTEVSVKNISMNDLVHRSSQPKSFKLYELDIENLKTIIRNAPDRNAAKGVSNTIVEFPNPDGKFENFRIFESPIMHKNLAVKYPMIKTYAAQGIDDPTATMRFSITQFGLHTMSLSGIRNAAYIDPYTKDGLRCIVYDRAALADDDRMIDFECYTEEGYHIDRSRTQKAIRNNTDDQKLRTYRLAQSCTAEYGNIFQSVGPGTPEENIQAQMAITINRVNEIYERDLAITLEFIPNNDLLIYYGDTNADPWTFEWNTTTQNTIDSTIGDANYDIGHNFNTTGGGNAGCLSCVCLTGQKGSGYTGRADPTGDPFDIDYVAHEMGHQFGGWHTMNTCSRSGSGTTEVEPASGSSIMGYAGICTTNVQMNSDAHFNYVNIRDISANVQPGGNSTCASETVLSNNPPTADAGGDYTIPQGTAFVLEGSATDPDGIGSLTYNWSQNDPERAPTNGSPLSTWTVGPLSRAKLPITSPNRYLPQFVDVLAGNLTPTWEVTPSVSRNMEFSFIVRDNDVSGGQTASDLMNITVDGNSGPFVVTSQTTSETWDSGTSQIITWDVAGTNAAPVNATNVDILITADGGVTFVAAATSVANNGSYTIAVPSGLTTTTARVMVRGTNTIFYAINDADLTIQDSEFAMNFNATSVDICVPDNAVFTFTYNTFNGFNETTVFSATGNPAGSNVTFSPLQASTDGTIVTMTVSGLNNTMLGQHTINVVGTATSVTKNTNVQLGVFDSNFTTMVLTSPVNNATGISVTPTLTWNADSNALTYDVEVSDDSGFTNIVASSNVATNSYTVTPSLNQTTQYYWRVRPVNDCGIGSYSAVSTFTTMDCSYCSSTFTNTTDDWISNVSLGAINNSSGQGGASSYEDFTTSSTDLDIGSTYTVSVDVTVNGNWLQQTWVWIDWNQNCDFTDPGESFDLGVTPGTAGTHTLSTSITVPAGALLGTTTMRVIEEYLDDPDPCDPHGGDYGETEDYTVNVLFSCAGATTTWDGTSWDNGVPDATNPVIIAGNYTTDVTHPSIDACSCEVLGGAVLTISAGNYLEVIGDIDNNGTIVVEHEGSLVQYDETDVNTGTGMYQIHKTTRPYTEYDYTFWSSPVEGETVEDAFINNSSVNLVPNSNGDPGSPANYIFWLDTSNFNDDNGDTFDDESDDWIVASGNMERAKGYIAMGAGSDFPFNTNFAAGLIQSIYFESDRLNNGSFTYPLLEDNSTTDSFINENLIGNPYASAIDLQLLRNDLDNNPGGNSVISPTVWFWSHDTAISNGSPGPWAYNFTNADYAVFNIATDTGSAAHSIIPTRYMASCQSILFEANMAGTLHFKNAMRVTDNNDNFIKSKNESASKIWLNLSTEDGLYRQLAIVFMEGADDNVNDYDSKRKLFDNEADIYSLAPNHDDRLVIQGLSTFTETKTISLGMEIITSGEYSIKIDQVEGVFENEQNIYLKDHFADAFHNLSDEEYLFTVTNSEVGEINNRFELRFIDETISIQENIFDKLVIYPNPSKNIFRLLGIDTTDLKVTIFNPMGKIVLHKSLEQNSGSYQIDLTSFANGVYFATIEGDGQRTIRKLILK